MQYGFGNIFQNCIAFFLPLDIKPDLDLDSTAYQ